MTKRKPDWADKKAVSFWDKDGAGPEDVARALRAAERRGYMRAVKMLREKPGYGSIASLLEEKR